MLKTAGVVLIALGGCTSGSATSSRDSAVELQYRDIPGDVIEAMQAHNEAAQLEHHWGVPLMVLNGEPFFGQDRIDSLTWRLDQLGLRRD